MSAQRTFELVSQIVSLRLAKHYAEECAPPGVFIRLEELP